MAAYLTAFRMITPPMNERAPDLNGDEGFMEIMIAKL
jgi:hypothetical protein